MQTIAVSEHLPTPGPFIEDVDTMCVHAYLDIATVYSNLGASRY